VSLAKGGKKGIRGMKDKSTKIDRESGHRQKEVGQRGNCPIRYKRWTWKKIVRRGNT